MELDKIQLMGMVFYGYHGVAPAEQEIGQRFLVDLVVYRDLSQSGRSDDLHDTVSYSHLWRAVRQVIEGPPRKLLENVAEAVAKSILDGFDVDAVRITVKKPEVPMKGSILNHAAVEIFRERQLTNSD